MMVEIQRLHSTKSMKNTNRRKLFPEERRAAIEALLAENGRVSVNELTMQFDVSKVTVRSDLDRLEQDGVIKRTHGGAIALSVDVSRADPEFFERARICREEKARIGIAGAELVQDGMTVLFDASTTSLQVARQIKERRNLTVLTNCLPLAMEIADAPGVNTLMLGGNLRTNSWAVVGPWVVEQLARVNVDLAFMGCKGISAKEGLTDVNTFLIETKRAMVTTAQRVIAVAEHRKWGRVAFASYATLDQVSLIISGTDAPPHEVDAVLAGGVEVLLV